jgi:ABC-type multidrug transport system fused ATPase/permease subunit
MHGVKFGYDQKNMVLENISISVEPGQKVALVGPSGAGKSTCFELATGFRIPQAGEVRLGGETARHLLEGGDGVIGIVPQRPHLVSGTLSENVSLVDALQTNNIQVMHCLKMAGLNHMSNPDFIELQIRPDSGQLSGGEIQRVGLARALYRNPGILFLDEATSALDAQTEAEVNGILDRLRGQMTIVLIAHRLSTVKTADKIIYLDKGQVVAEGTFKELQKKVPDFEKAVKLMELE